MEPDFSIATKCFYCPVCELLVEDPKFCASCKVNMDKRDLLKSGKFFIQFDLRASLLKVLELPEIKNSLQNAFKKRQRHGGGKLEDIMDGECYKKLALGYFDLTCSINTDGVSVFRSSKCSLWPIFISVNELEYKVRRRFTLLVGLWFGPSKPNFDIFLKQFVVQCNDLSVNGLQWKLNDGLETVSSKVFFPIVAADSVARCSLQGIKQFNGKYGCPWCLTKGETFRPDETSRKWIFPPETASPRTKENFISNLKILKENLEQGDDRNCFGVKSASQFLLLNQFNIVDGFVFDYMHTCLLGVVKTYTSYWLDSKYHEKDYYIGTKEDLISNNFCRVKIPSECNRVTRGLKDIAFWKANEWKTWMIACIPVLHDILKLPYLKHFAKFVHAILILMGDTVTVDDINIAHDLIVDFVYNAPNLYGEHVCTFNLHLLLHAAQCVKNWGPLWCYSLFQFEHNNGVLTSLFNGTRQVCSQIVKKVILSQQVRALGTNGFGNELAKSFFSSLIDHKRFSCKYVRCSTATLLGSGRKYTFNEREKKKLVNSGRGDVLRGKSYKTVIFNGKSFSPEKFNTLKHTNAVVRISGLLYVLFKILLVNIEGCEVCLLFVKRIFVTSFQNLDTIFKVSHVSNSFEIVEVSVMDNAKYVCYYLDDGKLLYICQLPNATELE